MLIALRRRGALRACAPQILREELGVSTILALTATATLQTERSVLQKLGLPRRGAVFRASTIRPNLQLSVSVENDRKQALLALLRSPGYREAQSIIIYAFYKRDVDELARWLQSKLFNADGYHAGKDGAVRQRVQDDFIAGKIRIVVATVAFGMGINKSVSRRRARR